MKYLETFLNYTQISDIVSFSTLDEWAYKKYQNKLEWLNLELNFNWPHHDLLP